jgi:hypothetical protein
MGGGNDNLKETSWKTVYDRSKPSRKCGICKYFGNLITINPKYTGKIKSGVAMTKTEFKTWTTVSASK